MNNPFEGHLTYLMPYRLRINLQVVVMFGRVRRLLLLKREFVLITTFVFPMRKFVLLVALVFVFPM